jgi:alpha-beta hydrolase superfamily lysophospholipase
VTGSDVRGEDGLRGDPGRPPLLPGLDAGGPARGAALRARLAEHSGRYDHVARHFAARGYASHAIDLRGHGRSPGPRVHVDSFDPWLDDVKAGLVLVRRAHPGVPVVVVGHSQGGLVVLLQALRDPDDRAATVVSSPLLGVAPRRGPGARCARSRGC